MTSAVSREGKTSLSYSLALSLSRCTDDPTLLLDADMRAPDLHAMCDIARDPGSGGSAERSRQAERCDRALCGRADSLAARGQAGSEPAPVASQWGLRQVAHDLRKRYRHIVIDCPPVLAASETIILAAAADGSLLCTMRDISLRRSSS